MSVVAIVLCYVATPKTKEHAAAKRVSAKCQSYMAIPAACLHCCALALCKVVQPHKLIAADVQCTSYQHAHGIGAYR